ncbi:MAG TPA: hypothetical protein VFB23_14245 [Candidatus Acidoferrales bacterium]|jgi:hypothetical protein|nr:hypothetical protein [Candidatus Acidoferrales bacterium]
MKQFFAILALAVGCALPLSAHVGSPDVFLEGNAGPYKLFVTVRVPQVIPGIADVEIRSESKSVSEIRIAPMQLTGPGSQFAPAPELTARSKDDPQFFRGSLWLMEFGALQVRIEADGSAGKGMLAVPIPAVAQRTLPMQRSLGTILFVLMMILSIAMISIVVAAVREGKLAPGAQAAGVGGGRRAWAAAVIAALVVAAILIAGEMWWRADERQYARHIYTPPEIEASVNSSGELLLRAAPMHLTSGNPRRPADLVDFNDLAPDHEHLMHLFLIRRPGLDVFWHLHPQRAGSGSFVQNLPSMPAGQYEIFADVVLSNGFPVTMVGQIEMPSGMNGKTLIGDDSGIDDGAGSASIAPAEYALADGYRMIWERDAQPLKAGVPLILHFRVIDKSGKPAADLEPYMGMAAHAAIVRSDGSVFAHVHPTGSVPMASFELAQAGLPRSPGELSLPAMDMSEMSAGKIDPEIAIPYGFPKRGNYRVFVQVKRAGEIQTAFFDADVN